MTEKLVEQGEMVAPRTPIVVVADLDHAWGNVYVTSRTCRGSASASRRPSSPTPAAAGFQGRISFVSSQAEFTPRNVQTAEERSKLVYRIKIPMTTGRAF